MLVKVFHNELNEISETYNLVEIAHINANCDNVDHALEYAYRRTNNIEGSWSMGPTIKIDSKEIENADYSVDITVCKELKMYKGQLYGHRSSMMNDVFEVDGTRYKVAMFGFEEVE